MKESAMTTNKAWREQKPYFSNVYSCTRAPSCPAMCKQKRLCLIGYPTKARGRGVVPLGPCPHPGPSDYRFSQEELNYAQENLHFDSALAKARGIAGVEMLLKYTEAMGRRKLLADIGHAFFIDEDQMLPIPTYPASPKQEVS